MVESAMSPELVLGLVFLAGLLLVGPLVVAVTRTSREISHKRSVDPGSIRPDVAFWAAYGQGADHCSPGDGGGGGSCDGGGGGS